jgi:hypothetical protein
MDAVKAITDGERKKAAAADDSAAAAAFWLSNPEPKPKAPTLAQRLAAEPEWTGAEEDDCDADAEQ